jgi:ABC-2 type transport system permease protein
MNILRQSWVLFTQRYLRLLVREPSMIGITLTQPVIWLLLFGELFRKVAQLHGFGSVNYATYLTPGVVIMTALFSSSWTGMTFIEDMASGVMDRFLTAPVRRSALIVATMAYVGSVTVVQSLIIILMGWAIGASFPAGSAGILALLGVAVLISVAMAGLSDAMGLLTRQRETLIAFSSTLVMPLTFLSGAFISLTLVPGWIQAIARFNPVNWAASAGRIAVQAHPRWSTVGSYAGFLALAVIVCAVAATGAFRAYRRSI